MELTAAQNAVLICIKKYIASNGYPPTTRELGRAVGYSSTSTVHGHLQALKKKGYIDWIDGAPRTLRILNMG
ncbi:LexA repressor [Alicyclobacillus suci]|uniref:LexA family protein n=1 Tax=Alicyclobacillus suci TaxID=2816080 RepID=UPI001A8FDCC1